MAHSGVLRSLVKGGYRPGVVFDVGANVGNTAGEFAATFPDAAIRAFEPVAETYGHLVGRVGGWRGVTCHRLALGRDAGQVAMRVDGISPANRLVGAAEKARGVVETVERVTGDAFCAEHGIDRVGLLKIDTEGHDLDVVLGFREMILGRRVDFVQVECGLARDNDRHVTFVEAQTLMTALGYGFFGLFDLVPRKRSGVAAAFYGNAVFVRPDLAWPVPRDGAGSPTAP